VRMHAGGVLALARRRSRTSSERAERLQRVGCGAEEEAPHAADGLAALGAVRPQGPADL
jgi:hypothetical protein